MTFITADSAKGFTYASFLPDYNATSTGDIRFEPRRDATPVTWTNVGSVGRNPRMHCLARSVERMAGPDFEAGLANPKALAERH